MVARWCVLVFAGLVQAVSGTARAEEPLARLSLELSGTHTFVQVEVGGEMLDFVFDTGASDATINQATARRLGLEPTAEGTATGAGGRMSIGRIRGLTFNLGGLELRRLSAGVLPFEHLEAGIGRPIDGIIGGPVLAGRIVVIDYDRRRIEVFARRGFSFAGWGEGCALAPKAILPQVRAEIELVDGARLSGPFFIDSGAGIFLAFSSPFVEKHRLTERAGPGFQRTGRALTGKPITSWSGHVARVSFCGHELPPEALIAGSGIPAVLSGATGGVLAMEGPAGLIGNELLIRFNMALDVDRKRVYLQPNSHWTAPILSDGSGLHLIREVTGVIRVREVIAASPGEEAGFAPSDTLDALDGEPAARLGLPDVRDRLKRMGETVTIETSREGESRSVALTLRPLGG